MKKKQKALRKIFLTALLFVTISFAATRLFQVPEAAATQNITGWFWSSTAGWVSLSCQNTNSCSEVSYGVIEQADGLWTGYGWSDNLGWLRFDAGCPNGLSGQCGAKRIGDTIQGFARFCAPSLANSTCGRVTQTTTTPGGSSWDGWVSLSSQNDHISGHDNGAISPSPYVYGLTWSNNQLEGFVWGGQQVVGWMKYVAQVTECSDNVDNTDTEDEFADEVDPGCHTDGNVNNPLSYDPNDTSELDKTIDVTLTANPSTIALGESSVLEWTSFGAVTCTGSGFSTGPSSSTAGNTSVSPSVTTTYSVTCVNAGGLSANDSAIVTVTTEEGECDPMIDKNCPQPPSCTPGIDCEGDPCEEEGICPNECIEQGINCPTTSGIPECSDNVDNTDTEDEFADEVDPGCHTDGNVNNPLSYDPNDTSESNRRRPIYIEF